MMLASGQMAGRASEGRFGHQLLTTGHILSACRYTWLVCSTIDVANILRVHLILSCVLWKPCNVRLTLTLLLYTFIIGVLLLELNINCKAACLFNCLVIRRRWFYTCHCCRCLSYIQFTKKRVTNTSCNSACCIR